MPSAKKRIKSNTQKKKIKAFPIIGIGASAGGLDAIGSFFDAMPAIFLDDNLCIRRFSASAEKIVALLETDVGRPFKQLSSNVLDVESCGNDPACNRFGVLCCKGSSDPEWSRVSDAGFTLSFKYSRSIRRNIVALKRLTNNY